MLHWRFPTVSHRFICCALNLIQLITINDNAAATLKWMRIVVSLSESPKCYVFVISFTISAIIIGNESNTKHCTLHITLLPRTYYLPWFSCVFLFLSASRFHFYMWKKCRFITTIIGKYWLFGVQYSSNHSTRPKWLLFVWLHFVFGFCGGGPFCWHLRNNGHFSALGIRRLVFRWPHTTRSFWSNSIIHSTRFVAIQNGFINVLMFICIVLSFKKPSTSWCALHTDYWFLFQRRECVGVLELGFRAEEQKANEESNVNDKSLVSAPETNWAMWRVECDASRK